MRTKVFGCSVTNIGLRDSLILPLQIINIVELKEFSAFSINLLYIPALWALYIMFYSFRSSDAALQYVYITIPSLPGLISDLKRNFVLHYSILSCYEIN